ncbi:hypothetical protein RIF29_40050 [Crotalaria pallida]|uniref:Uncharacterized protein n=1 Tax=Crotalaria pallida TaxID=3830 RepID=A0AAN9E7V4_CROPI
MQFSRKFGSIFEEVHEPNRTKVKQKQNKNQKSEILRSSRTEMAETEAEELRCCIKNDDTRPIQEGTVDVLLEAERVAEDTKHSIKRKIAQAASIDFQSRSLPAKLRIEPDDPEDVVLWTRKLDYESGLLAYGMRSL